MMLRNGLVEQTKEMTGCACLELHQSLQTNLALANSEKQRGHTTLKTKPSLQVSPTAQPDKSFLKTKMQLKTEKKTTSSKRNLLN